MKKIIVICAALMLIMLSNNVHAGNKFPFAPKGKYGVYRTKQCKLKGSYYTHQKHKYHTKKNKRIRQKEAWIYAQWTRN